MANTLRGLFVGFLVSVSSLSSAWGQQNPVDAPRKLDFFPVAVQFSPVPNGEGWHGQSDAIDEATIRATIDNILAHGFTGLQMPTHRPESEEAAIRAYAQSRGMFFTYEFPGGLENFDRSNPPDPCIYSPQYAEVVRDNVRRAAALLKKTPGVYNVFAFQDEPFHDGEKSFGYNDEVKAEFNKRYGYDLPGDLDSIRNDPRRWLDVVNFHSDYFADGWRQVYKALKQANPGVKVIMTHDSHTTLGGGAGSNARLTIDDVFHWGGDFADTFVFDIYPYMMFDFRFGEPGRLPKPRISQAHYAFAQMRNLARAYGKEMGFWVGTYNPAWFKDFLGPEREATYWSEREMATTAVAQGADYLITGFHIPTDARHWESFGEGLCLIQRAGSRLLGMPKVKARACMLFPRTQMIQLQEEYFNVGLSYELFLWAFGELDILHEEQVKDDRLDGYQILVLFDVTLLPADVARRIASFVEKGGIVIADCVPHMDAYKQPMHVMEQLFGVAEAKTDRVRRTGHWVPCVNGDPYWMLHEDGNGESAVATDVLQGTALGQSLDLTIVSPRPATVTTGGIALKTASGQPAIVSRRVGKGQVFLLGFCLQDTYFKTWQDDKPEAREQLTNLLCAITMGAGVQAHVRSTTPDIEASVRANDTEGFLFVINHEAAESAVTITVTDLGFEIREIVDLASGQAVPVTKEGDAVELKLSVPVGQTQILHLKRT